MCCVSFPLSEGRRRGQVESVNLLQDPKSKGAKREDAEADDREGGRERERERLARIEL